MYFDSKLKQKKRKQKNTFATIFISESVKVMDMISDEKVKWYIHSMMEKHIRQRLKNMVSTVRGNILNAYITTHKTTKKDGGVKDMEEELAACSFSV